MTKEELMQEKLDDMRHDMMADRANEVRMREDFDYFLECNSISESSTKELKALALVCQEYNYDFLEAIQELI